MSRTRSKMGLVVACGLLAGAGLADQPAKPNCCARPARNVEAATAAANQAATPVTRLECSLTGKIVDKCCCEQRDGSTYCTLAKKAVEKCCCSPVAAGTKSLRP